MASQPTQATQGATQPYNDPRRAGRTLSEMSDHDAADVICVLHANSQCATRAVRATMLFAPEHVLQNEDLDGVIEEDLLLNPRLANRTREIALRMSSAVKLPKDGFRFGRNPDLCDVLLTDNTRDKLVSNVHFSIFVHEQGSLMIQDCSTNGTFLDDELLKSKDKKGRPLARPMKRVLKNGNIISVLVGTDRQEIKFMVRIPNRTNYENVFEQNLRKYLDVRGIAANFASIRESSFGNHWTGGSLYNFTGLLGKGAFATVYRVQTKSEGTVYAAKEIDKRRWIKNGVLDVKFDNELQIMQRLKHPNIVNYVDCQAYESWIYIIMEYIPYGELSKELQTRGRIPEDEVRQITRQTLRALDYLHRQGITHRDIKPDNILISSRNPVTIKLSDFGLSKSVIDQETFLKTFCGTLLYCAPEVYPDYGTYAQAPAKRRRHGEPPSKTAPYDSMADMWSFGAVVFHLLAGKAPIMGRGENGGAQMLNNIMTKPVDFEPLRDVGTTEAAIDFIGALLNRHPGLRPQEKECFNHPWLKDVQDVLDYSSVSDLDFRPRGRLEDVDEEDEADEELINDLQQLTQNPGLQPIADDPPSTPSSPERPTKRPKIRRLDSTIPEEVLYPHLPSMSSQPTPKQDPGSKSTRLFGEVTASVLKSSGLFGGGTNAALPSPVANKIPQIQNQLEQVSMNDFACSPAEAAEQKGNNRRAPFVGDADVSYAGPPITGSAASLMGAEAQIGQMNIGLPEADFTDAPTPETNNPMTPQTGDITPAQSMSKADPENSSSQQSLSTKNSRLIDVDLVADEEAFAAEQRLRQAAREENARLKAQTFHVPSAPSSTLGTGEPAKTFSAPARPTNLKTNANDENSTSSTATEVLRQVSRKTFAASLGIYGKLIPTQGSFSQEVVPLFARSTLWGRAPQCNHQYPNLQDTRVPKFGMKVVFYAPGIEDVEQEGRDWTKVPSIRTIIATSATRGIKVNDVHLTQESEDGRAALFGKIYTGDIITIADGSNPGSYLKFTAEITFGDSALPRPESEKPFIVQKEYKHHARMKEQSMHVASHEDGQSMTAPSLAKELTVT